MAAKSGAIVGLSGTLGRRVAAVCSIASPTGDPKTGLVSDGNSPFGPALR